MSIIDTLRGFCYASEKTKQETLDLTRTIVENKIKGDFVECGVAQGVQIAIMESVNKQQEKPRKVWAFDSFQGIPLATKNDTEQPGVGAFTPATKGEHLKSSGITVHNLTDVKTMLTKWCGKLDNFIFVEGWFEETVPGCSIDKIAMLRLDGDLYESTKVCLEHLFPKLVKGGILIVDDWGLAGCRKACDEFLNYNELEALKDFDTKEPMNFIKK